MAVFPRTRVVVAITAGALLLAGAALLLLNTGGEFPSLRRAGVSDAAAAADGTIPASRKRTDTALIQVVPFAFRRAADADEGDADAFLRGQLQIRDVPTWRGTLAATLRTREESAQRQLSQDPEVLQATPETTATLTEAAFSLLVPRRGTYECVFRVDGVKNHLHIGRGTDQKLPILTALIEAITVDATKFGPGITAVTEQDSGAAAERVSESVWRIAGPWLVPMTVVLELGSPGTTVAVRTTTDSDTLRLAVPTCALMRVHVVDAGTSQPIEGAAAYSELLGQGTLRTTTDGDGGADLALPVPVAPRFSGRIEAVGYETVLIGSAGAVSLQRGAQPARIEMVPKGNLRGRVIGADGAGVAGARVSIFGAKSGIVLLAGNTTASGAVRLFPPSAPHGIAGSAAHPWSDDAAGPEALASEVVADVHGVFGPVDWASIVSGALVINTGAAYRAWDAEVHDEAGRPLAGAHGWITPVVDGHLLRRAERATTRPSDASGRLRLPPVYAGQWQVRVEADAHSQITRVVSPEAGAVPVVLDATSVLRLQFANEDGTPAPSVGVAAWRADASGTALDGAAIGRGRADSAGRVNLSLDGGGLAGFSCTPDVEHMLSLRAPRRVPIGGDKLTVIPMCRARRTHIQSTPLPGVAPAMYVEATANPPQPDPRAPIGQMILGQGDLRLPAEPLVLAAFAMGALPQTLPVNVAYLFEPPIVVITWEAGPRVRGRLVRRGSALPHHDVVLRLMSPETLALPERVLLARAKTDEDGRFEVLVRPGTYDVSPGDGAPPSRRGVFIDRDLMLPDIDSP